MKTLKPLKMALVLSLAAVACAFGLTACGSGNVHGAAATVNGVDIQEDSVTDGIARWRSAQNLDSEEQWGMFLAAYGYTPSDLRDAYISQLRDRELMKEGAPELGVELDTAEVEMQIQSLKANFSDDAAWKKSLADANWTEDEYRAEVEANVLQTQLTTYFKDKAEVTDEIILETANMYSAYYNDRKRTSHILIRVDDSMDDAAKAAAREKAQGILNQIKAGTLTFEDAVAQYSDDTASAQQGGDVGFDSSKLVAEYRQGYADLEVGQISDLVESQFGYHIIKVTEKYEAPEEVTSLDQIPDIYHEELKQTAESVAAQKDYTAWLQGLRDAATFTQNPMPSGLPYDVDVNKYKQRYEQLMSQMSTTSEGASVLGDGTSASSDAASSDAASASSESASASASSASSSSASESSASSASSSSAQ